MNKVITINLNGRAYQLEEAGYDDLRRYLDQAAAKLDGNPDKDEIMADFEQAIADKCDARLSARKNVVTAAEISEIIASMGPVDAGTETSEENAGRTRAPGMDSGASDATQQTPKRLYQIRQGAWISGVCNGLAAYFGVDVTLMRVIFVVLGAITHGFWILPYVILMVIMPVARTEEEMAAARGTKPFNAHDFIEQAKSRYADFEKEFHNHPQYPPMPAQPADTADKEEWDRWRDSMKIWKQNMKSWRNEWKHDFQRERMARRMARREARDAWRDDRYAHAGMGFFRFVMGIILAALFFSWIVALLGIIQHHMFFGVAVAAGYPLWVSIVFVCALFYIVSIPFKFLMRGARPWYREHYNPFIDIVESLFFIVGVYLVIWIGRELFPAVNTAYLSVVNYLQMVWPWK
ncbi:MAG TPA: PspC domain-containing protein [Candidatus Paceibacterota bacterium]|nr:PspC domain-containing protein [Candidatus Paceibacterota bacterium]